MNEGPNPNPDLNRSHIKGLEVIGHEFRFGAEPDQEIKSRFYSFLDGMTLDYVHEMDGETLMIWAGKKGSPAFFTGTFSEDGNTLSGSQEYPGGGYEAVSTRVSAKE